MKVYDLFEDGDNMYVVSEFIDGKELFHFSFPDDKLTLDHKFQALRQILSALTYLEEQQVMHRDLKLENVMCQESNDAFKCKLIDFGLALKTETGVTHTRPCGTLDYKAPEVLKEKYNLASNVDMWSFGVLLYTLFSGLDVWQTKNSGEKKRRIKGTSGDYPIWDIMHQVHCVGSFNNVCGGRTDGARVRP